MYVKISSEHYASVFTMRQIDVFSAPRLSVPVCLVEPVSSYSLDSIPSDYWKPLNDAAELIERIKQRTTKVCSQLLFSSSYDLILALSSSFLLNKEFDIA